MTEILIHTHRLFDRFEMWFNEKYGWFFTNGRKKPYKNNSWYFRA